MAHPSTDHRVLFLTTSFPRHEDDWVGRFVAEFAGDLTRRRFAVRVLAPGRGWAPDGVERLRYRVPPGLLDGRGAPDALRTRPLVAGAAAAGSAAGLMAAAVRYIRPGEAIVGHWLVPSGPAALAAARRHGAPVHLFAHGSDVALLEGMPGGRALARRLDAGADSITFVSADLAARFAALRGRAARTCEHIRPMGVAVARPDAERVRAFRALTAGRRVIATVGRIAPIKGYPVLADALRGRRDVLWIAAGPGSGDALAARCQQNGVALHLCGAVGPGERDALLAVADVLVVPSRPVGRRREGTPVVALEALASGVPLIASVVGGLPAVAEPAGALLVPPDDPVALRAALDAVLDDEEKAGEMAAAHRIAGAAYRWSAIGAEHAEAIAAGFSSSRPSRP